ncbi:MAG: formyltransferase family protein, partial [Chloroflexota bacterium]
YRGPTPLFWIAHQGEERSGVTLHFLDEGIDSGDIVTQVEFDLPLGISEFDLTMLCADYGATLLVEALQDVLVASLPRRPQRNGGRYFLAPSQTDFEIDTTWPAQRAFRFLRGANRWPLTIKTGDTDIIVDTALDYLPEAQLAQPILVTKDECWLQMTPGVLKIRMK